MYEYVRKILPRRAKGLPIRDHRFDLYSVFATVADAIPDSRLLLWRDREFTYRQVQGRALGLAHYLTSLGLGCHTERSMLAGHESGQDHLGLYMRNGNQYLESMLGGYRARVAPFNVNYRYVDEELLYLLDNAGARAVVYAAEFAPRVAAIRHRLPRLTTLIQVDDGSGHDLLPGAASYESVIDTPEPGGGMPVPDSDDLYLLYTGGTTGMPKGVLWRQHNIFVSSMGGRPFGSAQPLSSYDELAVRVAQSPGTVSAVLIAPFMHGAAQWAAFHLMTMGGWMAVPDDVTQMRPAEILRLVEREKVMSLPVVGDAIARPLIDEIEVGDYDLSSLVSVSNGGAPLTPSTRKRILDALPHVFVIDAAGASESGLQMNSVVTDDSSAAGVFSPGADSAVVADDLGRVLAPGEGEGWLARRDAIPLGYLGDADKTARAFPTIDGERWSVPGDRARYLADGRIELLGRDSVTINSGGEKVYPEEVEEALKFAPGVFDVLVVGVPDDRWGSRVEAVVQMYAEHAFDQAAVDAACRGRVAGYKAPRGYHVVEAVPRHPNGKPDYKRARAIALGEA